MPRKGRRRFAHLGPCSRILGLDVKYLSSVCDGGEPEVKASQKAWAVDRMSSPFALESVIFGKEGSVQSDLLRPCN